MAIVAIRAAGPLGSWCEISHPWMTTKMIAWFSRRAIYSMGWWAYGNDGVAFAARGDSGSVVIDEARRVVGMVVAVENEDLGAAAFVHGIKQVLAALQIALP